VGLWISLKAAAWEANEKTHSERLSNDLFPTMQQVDALPDHLKEQALIRFLELREAVISKAANWSRDGILKAAKEFFSEARRLQDFDRCNSLGFALAGIWLESSARNNDKSNSVFYILEDVAKAMIAPIEEPPRISSHQEQRAELRNNVQSAAEPVFEKPRLQRTYDPVKLVDPVEKFQPMAKSLGTHGATQNNILNTLRSSGCPLELAQSLAKQFGKPNAI
jgi:hypothetical protein